MNMNRALNLSKLAAVMVLVVGLSLSASAACGDSMAAMASAAASLQGQAALSASGGASQSPNAVNVSIVGMWHIRFVVGDTTIQEAFQIWNTGGTEVHNPKVDPRGGSVCLGAWKEVGGHTFKLTHRVWSFDASGNYQGTIRLTETITLGDNGTTHSGTFTLDFFDPADNPVGSLSGNVVGERITVE